MFSARWMAEVDVALNDEGQQYGNLDEASAIARVPRKGIVIWCGDHKQTPGGLRKSDEARAFRRKLMRRPIALRGDTKFLPLHMLGAIVHTYVKDVPGPQVAGVSQLLQESTRQPLGLSTGSVAVFQELCKETIALLGRIRDHFCFPAVPAARLKVSACNGNLSGASASHNTAIAAQQHGVMPASQQLPVTTSKLSNALEGAFCQSSGMHHTATSMPALTLGK